MPQPVHGVNGKLNGVTISLDQKGKIRSLLAMLQDGLLSINLCHSSVSLLVPVYTNITKGEIVSL